MVSQNIAYHCGCLSPPTTFVLEVLFPLVGLELNEGKLGLEALASLKLKVTRHGHFLYRK